VCSWIPCVMTQKHWSFQGSFDWMEQFRRASMLLSIAVLTSVFFDSIGYPLSRIQIAKRWLEKKSLVGL
jgi:hypothetical protein